MSEEDDNVNLDALWDAEPEVEEEVEVEEEEIEEEAEEVEEVEEETDTTDTTETETETETEVEKEKEAEPEKEVEEPVVVDYKQIFGDEYESPEKVKEALGRLKEVETKLQEVEKTPPLKFASEKVKVMNNLLAADKEMSIETAFIISSLNAEELKTMDDRAKMRLKVQLEKPEIATNDRLVAKEVNAMYKTMPDEEKLEDMSDEEIQDLRDDVTLSDIKLKRDAAQFTSQMVELLEKAARDMSPQPPAPEIDRQAIKQEWEAPAKTILPKEISVPIDEWTKESLKFTVDQAEFAKLAAFIPEYASQNGIKLDDKAHKAIQQEVFKGFVFDNLPKIVRAVVDKTKAETTLEVERKYVNPSARRKETKEGKTEKGVDLSPLTD